MDMAVAENRPLESDGEIDWSEPGPAAETSQSEFMREYDSRRCHICGCRHPSFGFGAPLTKPGHTIWACLAHRAQVDRLLSPHAPMPFKADEPRLL